ncbi:MAG: 3-dehydroquinate synthase, partial [Spirochaetia bacterium]|nr:3-dehydroquinate synthase [Spirochaetia bacterium]
MEHLMNCKLGEKTTSLFLSTDIKEVLSDISLLSGKKLFIADENTKGFLTQGEDYILLSCGEEAKHLKSIEYIISEAKSRGFSRDDTFVALGGGVICDITGFAASLYMRGANLILIPTTLLSQVDASVGGKTGVDFDNSKNFIGTFYPSSRVYLSIDTLLTLTSSEYKNGLGEVLKHALLSKDSELTQYLTTHKEAIFIRDIEKVKEMIVMSLKVKMSYIERDPQEQEGIR